MGIVPFVMLCILLLNTANDHETIYMRANVDAVLVIDVSHSMRHADPNRIAQEAMNLFVDMLGLYGDRVGVVSYAGHVVESLPLTTIAGQGDKDYIKNFISQLYYASWTDHSLGLIEAMEILNENSENKQVIILLTDGNTNINPWIERTSANAEYDLYSVITEARKRSIPIHTIGLNYDGTLDQEYIDNIADATSALSFETDSADNLTYIIRAIFAELMESIIIEAEPTPSPTQIVSPMPTPEPTPTAIHDNGEYKGSFWLVFAGAFFIICIFIIILVSICRKKRVFTGSLFINILNPASTPISRSLIPYGRRTSLAALLEGKHSPLLTLVKLIPSPSAPSHMPRLIISCVSPGIVFRKSFHELNAAAGLTVDVGEVLMLHLLDENIQIRLKYTTD